MSNNNILRIQTVYTYLLTTNLKVKDEISKLLRARPKNYFMNPAYKNKKWDGWKYHFDAKSGRFLTGLLPEVKLACKKLGLEVIIVDERETGINFSHNEIDENYLNQWLPEGYDPIKLHDYQPDFTNKIIKHRRGIIEAPTGAGKTFVLVSMIKSLPPKTPILFLTKDAGLVHQNWEEMRLWGVENLGRWYGDFKELNFVMCATLHPKTFESLAKFLPKVKALVVDELHLCMNDVPTTTYRKMKSCDIRIGFSATPFPYHKKKIDLDKKFLTKGHFGPILKTGTTADGHLKTKDLQERGILSASECFIYPIDKPNLEFETYQDAVKMGLEQNLYFHKSVVKLARSCPGRTLVIVERIEQGEYLKRLMPEADWIYGDIKISDRQPVLERLRKNEKHIAIAMRQIITAGINVKIHDLINASGGDAAHNLIQQIGRGLRLAEDKDRLRFHDFLFLISDYLRKHSLWRMEVLDKEGHSVKLMDPILSE